MLRNILASVIALPFAVLVLIGLSALYALPVQWLYNYLTSQMPFGEFYHVSFKNAWAFTLLCRLLFIK